MTDHEIINAGYKEYEPTKFDPSSVEKCFQKRFDDNRGKKYFIDIKKWEEFAHPYTGEKFDASYEFHVQFCSLEGHPVNMNFFYGWSIEEAEKYIEHLFGTGLFKHYELFDEE